MAPAVIDKHPLYLKILNADKNWNAKARGAGCAILSGHCETKGGNIMQIRTFHPDDEEAVISLWRRCDLVRPWNDPAYRLQGHARTMIDHAERLFRGAGCPKISLQVRASNPGAVDFYRRLGYEADDVVSMGKRLEHDDA